MSWLIVTFHCVHTHIHIHTHTHPHTCTHNVHTHTHTHSMPECESFGIQFFSSIPAMSIRRQMKITLSTTCKKLQSTISELERGVGSGEWGDLLRTFLPKLLRYVSSLSSFLSMPVSLLLSLSFLYHIKDSNLSLCLLSEALHVVP